MLFAIITVILVLVFLIICFIKVNVVIEYNRQGVNDNFVVSFFVLKGLIKYKFEIPKVGAGKKGIWFRKVKEKEKGKGCIKENGENGVSPNKTEV